MSETPFDQKNLMVDLETMATTTDAAILSIGWASFTKTEGVLQSGQINIRSLDNLHHGRRFDPDTVAWWFSQPAPAIVSLVDPEPLTLAPALERLEALVTRHKWVWAKPPQFDLAILQNAYDNVLQRKQPWPHRCERDARTLLALGKVLDVPIPEPSGVRHCAQSDAINQAAAVVAILRRVKA